MMRRHEFINEAVAAEILALIHQTADPAVLAERLTDYHDYDIAQAPELVHTLWEDLRKTLPEIGAVPAIPQQSSLF